MLNEQINMSLKKYITRLTFLVFIIVGSLTLGTTHNANAQAAELPTEEAAIAEGAKLFKNNCAVCHQVQNKLVGPALKNVYERREIPWLVNFIQNSQKVIQGGDEYAVNLYNEYGKAVMPNFDYFSEDEIKNILGYIKNETENPPVAEANSCRWRRGCSCSSWWRNSFRIPYFNYRRICSNINLDLSSSHFNCNCSY